LSRQLLGVTRKEKMVPLSFSITEKRVRGKGKRKDHS